jgi:hypothetical protein
MLEQFPGERDDRAANEARRKRATMIRVPHSSGMLEGKYTLETTFRGRTIIAGIGRARG